MSAQLEKLRSEVQALAKQFKEAGQPDLANLLEVDARSFAAKAEIAKIRGLITLEREQAPKVNLRQQMYDLLPRLVEPTETEKEALRAKRGLVFLPMTAQSYAQVIAGDEKHFWDKELDYANSRAALRDFVPPVAVEVGLIEGGLALPNSFGKPRAAALKMIDDYSQELATEFPDFRAIALPTTGYASADRAYSKRNPGQVLFKNYSAWCLDNLSGVLAAVAGRGGLGDGFYVHAWYADDGSDYIGAVPAVVKIGSK